MPENIQILFAFLHGTACDRPLCDYPSSMATLFMTPKTLYWWYMYITSYLICTIKHFSMFNIVEALKNENVLSLFFYCKKFAREPQINKQMAVLLTTPWSIGIFFTGWKKRWLKDTKYMWTISNHLTIGFLQMGFWECKFAWRLPTMGVWYPWVAGLS